MVRIVDNDDTLKQSSLFDPLDTPLAKYLPDECEDFDDGVYDKLAEIQGFFEHLKINDSQLKSSLDEAAECINNATARMGWMKHGNGIRMTPQDAPGAASLDKSRESYQSEDSAP